MLFMYVNIHQIYQIQYKSADRYINNIQLVSCKHNLRNIPTNTNNHDTSFDNKDTTFI